MTITNQRHFDTDINNLSLFLNKKSIHAYPHTYNHAYLKLKNSCNKQIICIDVYYVVIVIKIISYTSLVIYVTKNLTSSIILRSILALSLACSSDRLFLFFLLFLA